MSRRRPPGATLYVTTENGQDTVTPVSTATDTAGRAIRMRPADDRGMTSGFRSRRTAYALCAGSVIPIRLPAGTAARGEVGEVG